MKLQMKREALAKLNPKAVRVLAQHRANLHRVLAQFWHSRGEGRAKTMNRRSNNSFGISRRCGRGGAIRTPDPLRPRQVRYQAALRPDINGLLHSKTLLDSPHAATRGKTDQNRPDRVKTVPKLHQLGFSVSKLRLLSFACRFSFCRASRFICSFICDYFLNTFASPCRSSWVTHSSATPPALRRVAYVERRS
jgi:hypothetical protein